MITSTSNPQVKRLLQLQKKSKARNEEGVFVVEGLRMFAEVPQERVKKVYVSETLFNRKKHNLNWEEFPLEILSDSVFKHVSDTQTPQGVLCIIKQKKYDLAALLDIQNPHFMVLDNLQDPGNLGTIVRTAEGAGVDAVFMSKDCVDIYNHGGTPIYVNPNNKPIIIAKYPNLDEKLTNGTIKLLIFINR